MVCASALACAAPAAGHVYWMPWGGLCEWPEKRQTGGEETADSELRAPVASSPIAPEDGCMKPPTPAKKEVLKLRKRLREIAKIEEQCSAGVAVDPLREQKLKRKVVTAVQLEDAERALAEEESAAEQEDPHLPGGQAGSECIKEHAPMLHVVPWEQAAPAELFPAPMVLCAVLAQPQQPLAMPMCALAAPEPTVSPSGQHFLAEPGVYHEPMHQSGQQAGSTLSISARRRLRRQRAAGRRADATELSVEAYAHDSQQSSPRSGASDGGVEQPGCSALMEGLEAGGDARAGALERMHGSVAQLAFQRQGCRVVQAAIGVAERAVVTGLVAELHGWVREACESPHANYVIQTIITALPTAMSDFVVKELSGVAARMARHRCGCRIICRLIEHSTANSELAVLLSEILAEAEVLCQHPFAHYVVECVLEHLPEHRGRIVEALSAD
eukprot:CAMPEP_0204527752 /NCGR_PEP_ID=MMETSP0661-20131031/9150_1 /ASSEMBLY_ACC=CAM_ASM_000606 /TAXON_ID=109239 /ORGANISM="Alexandrium margalefi, Strain AMGDE01CS-322" /LENGTH=442 /DNA_ID=CAMNT_0051533683 /DNA_START=53 /DNA_END=1378 /DNA_ORIENTATION=-